MGISKKEIEASIAKAVEDAFKKYRDQEQAKQMPAPKDKPEKLELEPSKKVDGELSDEDLHNLVNELDKEDEDFVCPKCQHKEKAMFDPCPQCKARLSWV